MRVQRAVGLGVLVVLWVTGCAQRDADAGLRRITIATGPAGVKSVASSATSVSRFIESSMTV